MAMQLVLNFNGPQAELDKLGPWIGPCLNFYVCCMGCDCGQLVKTGTQLSQPDLY